MQHLRSHRTVAIGNSAVFIMAEAGVVGACAAVIAMSLRSEKGSEEYGLLGQRSGCYVVERMEHMSIF